MVKNLPLLRRVGNNGRPWVHAVMRDNAYNDICMIIHASTMLNQRTDTSFIGLYAAPLEGTMEQKQQKGYS